MRKKKRRATLHHSHGIKCRQNVSPSSLSLLSFAMPVIMLNSINFDGKFDSSLPTSYVGPHVANVLRRLDDVVVTTFFGPKGSGSIVSCVLNFTIFERLISDCVLGADFFTQ